MSLFGALAALRRPQRQSLFGLIPVITSVQEAVPVPLTTCIDITASPYNCVHDASTTPSTTVLNANRIGLQAAIDAANAAGGAKLCAPAGYNIPFNKNTTGGATYGVRINSVYPICFEMQGVTLRANRASGASDFYGIQVLSTGAGGVTFKGVTFSQQGLGTGTEQMHMVQCGNGSTTGARYVVFDTCRFVSGVGGDGIRLLGSGTTDTSLVQDIKVLHCTFVNCDRAGVSFQRGVRRVLIDGCTFIDTGDQDIDFEPTGAGSLGESFIVNNTFLRTTGLGLCVTLTGQGDTSEDFLNRSVFANNTLLGGYMWVRKAKHLLVSGNRINNTINGTSEGSIYVSNDCENVVIANNHVRRTSAAGDGPCILAAYDAEAQQKRITITENTVIQESDYPAILLDSVADFIVSQNQVLTSPATTTHNVIQANNNGDALGYANGGSICDNTIRVAAGSASTGQAGIQFVSGVTPATHVNISDNFVTGTARGVWLLVRGAGTYEAAFACLPVVDRNTLANVSTPVTATWYRTGGSSGVAMSFVGAASPESVVPAPIGSTYVRTSNGDIYRKTSGTGNTGWVTP